MNIDKNSPIPLYYQLKQILIDLITQGTLKPGDMLPTEQQLQEQYEVSRTTVRQAMQELELEGRVTRYRGRGTFVARPKISHSPEYYPTLTDTLLEQGLHPGWRVLSTEWITPLADVVLQLQVKPHAKVYCVRRLRLENGEPIGYHRAYVAPQFADAIDESALAEGGSLRYLRGRTGLLEDAMASRILEAVPANQEESELLRVEKGSPMLLIRRLVKSQKEEPIEYFKGIYRGDRFQYHINNMRAINPINA